MAANSSAPTRCSVLAASAAAGAFGLLPVPYPRPQPAARGSSFSGKYAHKTLGGIGHNLPQETPRAFAEAVLEVEGYAS